MQLVGNEISEASTVWLKYLELACHIFAVVFFAKRCLYTYIYIVYDHVYVYVFMIQYSICHLYHT